MLGRRSRSRGSLLRRYANKSPYLAPVTVGITVATTLVVFFVTSENLGGIKLLITICIALLGAVLCLQLETLFTVAERNRARDQHGKLLELVEEFPELLPSMTRLAEAASTTLRETQIEEFRSHVAGVLADSYVSLDELTHGRLRLSGWNGLLHNRFATATRCLQGTTDAADTVWWQQESGRAFFDINKQLIAKGVSVQRFWLLTAAPDTATRQIIEEHAKARVMVYLVRTDRVEGQHVVNMTMMDEKFLHEDVANKRGDAVEYLYTANEADLRRAVARFAELRAHAVRYDGPASLDVLFGITGS